MSYTYTPNEALISCIDAGTSVPEPGRPPDARCIPEAQRIALRRGDGVLCRFLDRARVAGPAYRGEQWRAAFENLFMSTVQMMKSGPTKLCTVLRT